jgi:chromate reductase
MTTILHLSGSQRQESFNGRLLRHLAQSLKGRCIIDMVESTQVDLPLFDQDLETDPVVIHRVAELHQRFTTCDGMVVASPEYNGQLTPYLKNIVDWVSRLQHIDSRFDNPFRDRPLLLCSASTGWSGGALAMPHARALFGYVGCMVIGDAISIPHADQAWTVDGYVFDPFFDERIDAAVDRVLQSAQAFARTRRGELAAA